MPLLTKSLAALCAVGTQAWFKGYGKKDARPGHSSVAPGPDDQVWVASITKTFTSMLLYLMRDDGIVSLDDPVSHHACAVVLHHGSSSILPFSAPRCYLACLCLISSPLASCSWPSNLSTKKEKGAFIFCLSRFCFWGMCVGGGGGGVWVVC